MMKRTLEKEEPDDSSSSSSASSSSSSSSDFMAKAISDLSKEVAREEARIAEAEKEMEQALSDPEPLPKVLKPTQPRGPPHERVLPQAKAAAHVTAPEHAVAQPIAPGPSQQQGWSWQDTSSSRWQWQGDWTWWTTSGSDRATHGSSSSSSSWQGKGAPQVPQAPPANAAGPKTRGERRGKWGGYCTTEAVLGSRPHALGAFRRDYPKHAAPSGYPQLNSPEARQQVLDHYIAYTPPAR